MAAEETVTNYFSYVKNVLGVKTLQSARLRQGWKEHGSPEPWDVLFLNLKQAAEASVFAPESQELLSKMIQAMRLGERRYKVLEWDWAGPSQALTPILHETLKKISTPFVVVFSANPANHHLQNLGPVKFLETFNPPSLLNSPNAKKIAWADLQKVMKELGVK